MVLPTNVAVGDPNHVPFHNEIHALMPTGQSVSVKTKVGVPVDTDFPTTPPLGTVAFNTTTGRMYVRTGVNVWTEDSLSTQAKNGGKEAVQTVAAAGASRTLNLANANVFDITLTAANCTLVFSGQTTGVSCAFTLYVRQDATGNRAVSWPGSVRWDSGAVPALTTTASAVDVFSFETHDNGVTWFGYLLAKDIK